MSIRTALEIENLGRGGDGIASNLGKTIYVPYALKGEKVLVAFDDDNKSEARASLQEILLASPDRIEPLCPYFMRCGGCSMQHLAQKPYQAWKTERIREALLTRGLDIPLFKPLIATTPSGRRRAVLAARLIGRRLLFGFHEAGAKRIVDIEQCPLLAPALGALLPKLADYLALFVDRKKEARITLIATQSGVDLSLDAVRDMSAGPDYLQAVEMAETLDLARLCVNGEVLFERRPPLLTMGRADVSPPPGAFLQADASAEQAMAALVCEALAPAKNVIDLFCGIGTFALRLAEKSQVWAMDSEEPAIKALKKAWRFGEGLKTIKAEKRDLFIRPVLAAEMKRFQGLVFDPPRAGARSQAEQIAKSDVSTVVAVSCNPGTLTRDLRILVDGGYKLEAITPIDQFLFSPHVEAIAVLRR